MNFSIFPGLLGWCVQGRMFAGVRGRENWRSFIKFPFLTYMLKGESLLLLEARGMRGQGEIFLGIPRRYGVGQEEASFGFYPNARGNWENWIWANR